jgi:aerobic carbon-monoxide dehydrogenase medium subunit
MKPPPFSYHDPRTIADVVGLLGRLDNAKLLAGGQSLMPMLNMRFVLPDHIVDLNRVDGLSFIRESAGALEIGGMTRQRDLEFSDAVRKHCPLMHEAIRLVGHRQTRKRHAGGLALPSRSFGRARLGRGRARRDRDRQRTQGSARDPVRGLSGGLYDAGDRAR